MPRRTGHVQNLPGKFPWYLTRECPLSQYRLNNNKSFASTRPPRRIPLQLSCIFWGRGISLFPRFVFIFCIFCVPLSPLRSQPKVQCPSGKQPAYRVFLEVGLDPEIAALQSGAQSSSLIASKKQELHQRQGDWRFPGTVSQWCRV